MKPDTRIALGICLLIAGFFWYAGFIAAVLATGQWDTEVHGWGYPLAILVPSLGLMGAGMYHMIRALK